MASAPDPAPIERMEALLACCFCKQTLNEPRTLPCFHSLCKNCLSEYQRKEVRKQRGAQHLYNCPTCKTQFQLDDSVKSIDFINNMLDVLKIQQQAPKLPCESCKDQLPAECRCVQCERYLCKNCFKLHNNYPALNGHEVLTLEELAKPENQSKTKAKPLCDKDDHKDKPLEFFCNTCKELACMTCVLLKHPQPAHNCQTSGVVATQRKENLKTTSAFLQAKSNEGQSALQKIKTASQYLQAHNKKAKAAVLQHEKEILEEFTSKLKHHTAALIVEAERTHNEVNQTVVKQHDDLEAYVEKVNGSLEFVKYIVEKGSNEDVVQLGNLIKSNANDVEKKCPKSMQPVHCGYFEYVQKKSPQNIVDKVDLSDLGELVEPPVELLLKTSTILSGDIVLARQLAEWVDDEKFGWRLCYRASDDGWEAEDFHRKCDDVEPTVTLVKCGISVFGGYTDQSWKQNPFRWYKRSNCAFLFSLRNKDNIPPFKCPIYDHRMDKAIWCHFVLGATFGGGPDLCISSKANINQSSSSNLGDTYQPPPGYQPGTPQTQALLAGSNRFTPTEIEVFRG